MSPNDALERMHRAIKSRPHETGIEQWAAVVQAHALVEIAQQLAAIRKALEAK